MTIRIVRLGTPRQAGEGLRIGTVRRPPRGVPKNAYASQNWCCHRSVLRRLLAERGAELF